MTDPDDMLRNLDPTSRHDLRLLGTAIRALDGQSQTVADSLVWLAGATKDATVRADEGKEPNKNTRLAIRGLSEIRQWVKMELDHQEKTGPGDIIDVESGPYDVSNETARLLTRIDAKLDDLTGKASGEQSGGGPNDSSNGHA